MSQPLLKSGSTKAAVRKFKQVTKDARLANT
jgi:hypothetical protein